MNTTVMLDTDLLKRAEATTGLRDTRELVEEALRALIARESARQLARLGGSDPDAVAAPRRDPDAP